MEERALHHSTIWRVLTWLGRTRRVRRGSPIDQERCPASTCHRFAGAVRRKSSAVRSVSRGCVARGNCCI